MRLILNSFNPWWTQKSVPDELVGRRRKIFNNLKNSLSHRQITVVTGLRRVGKTTLMFQLIDSLLKEGINPFHIVYFSFDESQYDLNEILEYYQQEILKDEIRNAGKLFFFLDEIQKLPHWPEKIKILYDMFPNLKLTVSGSASILIFRESRESLAGRFFEYTIHPLVFDEFLTFRGVEVDFAREAVFKTQIIKEFQYYLKTGGFVEALSLNDFLLPKYFRETLLERVIFKDIPEIFPVKKTALIFQLLQVTAFQPGLYLEYKNLANDLKIDQRTVAEYFSFLEYSLLIQKLYNFSPNRLTSEKKTKRVYLSNTGFTLALNREVDFSTVVEQFWVNHFKSHFFYRSPQKDEVDIIMASGKDVLPIEIKIRQTLRIQDAAPLFKFMSRFNTFLGLMITQDADGEFKRNNAVIKLIPYWKYHTIMKFITQQIR